MNKRPVVGVVFGTRPEAIKMAPVIFELQRRSRELQFAPTSLARENLLAEGVSPEKIVVTGNTVVDAVKLLAEMRALDCPLPEGIPEDGRRIILITSHRRESWGVELENICNAIIDLVQFFPDIRLVYPVRMNPNVRNTVMARLGKIDRIHLT